ncbi:branched-chain amino acid ABC transporter permease [Marivibrio halodurans]|uniref:Branched-chain amino acid ABC transporter permease n=1 Tax=Marivibrio halodurans TaxID=2039722 RepID=A0A8J7RVF5_9PROT|nr:branched-chain amino acid ABC transporter permease [Marivibrio halodurans]MBP5855422.1 branched-chain amino acid ABC transporter permease [Marivibrio halodurans]
MHASTKRTCLAGLIAVILLVLAGFVFQHWQTWILFTATKAIGYGLVALGIITLMRGGLVSFGQGLVYCTGAYASGLMATRLGVTDAPVLLVVGMLASALLALIVSPLIARYRGIFFAMLTVALSMVLYGVLVKMNAIGGSDGFTLPEPTFLGWQPSVDYADLALYLLAAVVAVVASTATRLYYDSMAGLVALAVRENELRVEYLGSSVFKVTVRHFTIAGALGGLGGTLNGMALGHIDPLFSFWTTSGEFVFIAVLAGYISVSAVFLSAMILELVRSFSNLYFPETWQLILGGFLIVVIVFLPGGIGSFWERVKEGRAARAQAEQEEGAGS